MSPFTAPLPDGAEGVISAGSFSLMETVPFPKIGFTVIDTVPEPPFCRPSGTLRAAETSGLSGAMKVSLPKAPGFRQALSVISFFDQMILWSRSAPLSSSFP